MRSILLALLIAPGIFTAYAFLLRPILHRIPQLKDFYDRADGFWGTAWALCGKSLTVIWGLLLGTLGSAFELLTPIAAALGDPDIKTQIMQGLTDHPSIAGWVTIGIAVITILVRFRTLGA